VPQLAVRPSESAPAADRPPLTIVPSASPTAPSSEPMISVEGLGKKYRIYHQAQRHASFRDTLAAGARRLLRGQPRRSGWEEFWALRNVTFSVKRGEAVGIIGRNGAGKSTLLKVLSRITEASEGRIRLRGRVASLLEVGTGFHPELTGRENVFLNGAILGMQREEIRRKFDAIVSFAEVERFLDTPVKRYSSGMYMRLAFAVAAHLEPEILVVDEVLAVGDVEFQRKCLGRMSAVARGEGRTVLFVSHNMGAVASLCDSAIVMDGGHVAFHGSVGEAIASYGTRVNLTDEVVFEPRTAAPCITRVSIDRQGAADGDVIVDVGYRSPFALTPVPGLTITSSTGVPVFGSNGRFHPSAHDGPGSFEGALRFVAEGLPLIGGTYRLSVWLGDWHADYDQRLDVLSFDFRPHAGDARRPPPEAIGYMDWPGSWRRL
jgi:homopolymeric O-antigen transport system ATP-binding protein